MENWKKILSQTPKRFCLNRQVEGFLEETFSIGSIFSDSRGVMEDGKYLPVRFKCEKRKCDFACDVFVTVEDGIIKSTRLDNMGKCKLDRHKRGDFS